MFHFYTPKNCGSSKGFIKALKAFIKPFEAPQFSGGIETEHWANIGSEMTESAICIRLGNYLFEMELHLRTMRYILHSVFIELIFMY